jgi:restriction system protein
MKLKMHKDSLFAILLRSRWWISFAIAGGIVVLVKLVLPAVPLGYPVFAALPFIVIGGIAGWRQLRQPSTARVADTIGKVRAMSWSDFSGALEEGFRRDGYTVRRLPGPAADFEMIKGGRTSLVACKRWKVAQTGIDPLRELDAAARAQQASESIYVATGAVTDGALAFARRNNIRLVHGPELAKLLPRAVLESEGAKS